MENKNEWIKAKVATEKSVQELEEAERLDKIREEEIATEREAMEAREREVARTGQPEKIWVSRQQISTFVRKGQLDIAGLNLSDKVLNPGDIIFLQDEHLKEWPAELVSVEKTVTGNDRIRVKAPENKEE